MKINVSKRKIKNVNRLSGKCKDQAIDSNQG